MAVSHDIPTFRRRLRQIGENVFRNSNFIRREAAKEALRELILVTPVDTGEARSNWRVALGDPPGGIIPPYAPGEHLGINERANASAAIGAGFAAIDSSPDGADLVIFNNTRQIFFLDQGTSEQAPANFFLKAIKTAQRRIQRGKLLEGPRLRIGARR